MAGVGGRGGGGHSEPQEQQGLTEPDCQTESPTRCFIILLAQRSFHLPAPCLCLWGVSWEMAGEECDEVAEGR